MPNRAERRAQAKAGRRGVPSQYDQTRGRGRSGMIDEYQLQQKSQRLQDGTDATAWNLNEAQRRYDCGHRNPADPEPELHESEDVQGTAFAASVVPCGQLDADRHRDYRVLRGYVAAKPSDVADHHRFRGVHCGCAEPVLYGWRFQA